MKIAIIGLGYAGLPLTRLLSTKYQTIGSDMNQKRVESLMGGHGTTLEVTDALLQAALSSGFKRTSSLEDIHDCNFYIIAVPTPVGRNDRPDLTPLMLASETVRRVVSKGNMVAYESTVYLGVTEEECLPTVERASGLKFSLDFFADYLPKRINSDDEGRTIEKIKKVTSGSTPEIVDIVDKAYNSALINGTHRIPSIRVAEVSKIIGSSQHGVSIAFMNELAKIFNVVDVDINGVIEAASSKWNFIKLRPGLVGGHCISVDSYYLIQKARVHGILPGVMSSARRLDGGMGDYVANQVIKLMNKKGVLVKDSNILLLDVTFKGNCPDIRNTEVVDIYLILLEYTKNISVYYPWANAEKVYEEYGIRTIDNVNEKKYDAIVLVVGHNEFKTIDIRALGNGISIVFDVKHFLDRIIADGRLQD